MIVGNDASPGSYYREQLSCGLTNAGGPQFLYSTLLFAAAAGFLILLLVASLTHFGRSAVSYLATLLSFGKWNETQADRLLHSNRNLAMRMIFNNFQLRHEATQRQAYRDIQRSERRRRQRQGGAGERRDETTESNNGDQQSDNESPPKEPVSLALKTRIFGSCEHDFPPTTDDGEASVEGEEDCDLMTCSICIMELEKGDRVGALPCRHVFHVSCLKPWLQQNNVCPMCKREEIAQPKYETKDQAETQKTNQEAIWDV